MSEYNFYPFNYPEERGKKWMYNNRCVTWPEKFHMCGYVVFPKKKIPKDWWGNYEAPGLQRLAIHGGITYCEIEGATDQEKYEQLYKESTEKFDAEHDKAPAPRNLEEATFRINMRGKLKKELTKNLCKTDEGFVIFGFDTAHSGDNENADLKNPDHVMMLTEQMQEQLTRFADVYEQFVEAGKNPVTRSPVQKAIVQEVRRHATLKVGVGMGQMIEVLSGEVDADDLPT